MIKVDLHTHTNHSHGKNTVNEMYEQGKLLGLEIMGFSEHSPRPFAYSYPREYRDHLAATFNQYISSVEILKLKNDGPKVLLGLEMDYFPADEEFILRTIAAQPYEYIIGGLHFLDTWGFDSDQKDWDMLSEQKKYGYYKQYYKTMIQMAESGLVDIVAHPDLIKIFSINSFNAWLEKEESLPLIKKAITAIKANNMAMEISSAGLRKPCNEIYPGPKIMEIAKEVGVPISFGSDAHCVNSLGHAFDTLEEYAKSYGFTHSVYFCNGIWHQKEF